MYDFLFFSERLNEKIINVLNYVDVDAMTGIVCCCSRDRRNYINANN